MIILGFVLIAVGVITEVSWIWVVGSVIAVAAVIGILRGQHTRIVAGSAHYT